METVLVRYGEIGNKSGVVRSKMAEMLRQRVQDRLDYEDIIYEKVSREKARIIIYTEEPKKAAKHISEVPGVVSTSPAVKTEAEIESMKEAVEKFEFGRSFGVKTNRAGEHSFDSVKVNEDVGGFIENKYGIDVDLEDPETWLEIDIRFEDAYLFTERLEGVGGLPVGSEGSFAALISGGIDSPVAAYEIMKKGSDILPIFFYNKPLAAEDDLLRFKSVLNRLKRFHPGKKWSYYVVDMEEINQKLMELDRGRMVLHRILMFKVAGKIAEKEGLAGIVTGESLGQKSSQTASNLEKTTRAVEKPIHRPLLSFTKSEITKKARDIGTFEEAEINTSCRNMAPDNPATSLSDEDLENILDRIDIDGLVEKAFSGADKSELKE